MTPIDRISLRRLVVLGLGIWLLGTGPLGAGDGVTLKYTYRADQTSVSILKDLQGKVYLPLVEVAQFYGVQVQSDPQTRKITLSKGKNQVKLVLSQPVFLTSDPVASFPLDPVEMVAGQAGIPPESAEDILRAVLNVNVRYDPDQLALVVGGVAADEVRQEILASARIPTPVPTPKPVPALTFPTPTATVEAETTPAEETSNEEEAQSQSEPAQAPAGRIDEEMPNSSQIYQVRRIIIDPGHGGRDIGAKGFDNRYYEKQATLDIAKRVAQLLKEDPINADHPLEVFMTRETDHYITLKYRTDFANSHHADLFVSIHCNSNPHSHATGTETYVYSSKASNRVAQVAAVRENMGRDIDFLLNDLHSRAYRTRSYYLAEQVDQRIRERLGQHIRRIQQAPFYVLCRVDMPSILIETAFISNPKEENKLRDPYWKDKIAKAIADGILAYRDKVEESIENRQARR